MQNKKTILVIQFRTGKTAPHDARCFQDELQTEEISLVFKNGVEDDLPAQLLEQVDAVVIGGSSEYYLTKGDGIEQGWRQKGLDYIAACLNRNIPLLTVCFGSQMMALQQNIELTHDRSYHEVGSFEVSLTDAGFKDPLMKDLPSSFYAQIGHKDTFINPPDYIEVLAYSEKAPIHAYRIKGKQAWGILFHPELTKQRLRERLEIVPEYLGNKTLEETMLTVHESPEAVKVLHNFAHIVQRM